jgi:16S rRNA processing protein RimM
MAATGEPESGGEFVLVGAVTGAFGVHGEVRIKPFTAEPEGVVSYGPLYNADGRIVLTPKSWRAVKEALAVVAPEVKTREEAEALRNTPLYVSRKSLPPPGDEEFYHIDLIGCRVEDEAGAAIGEVVAVQNFGAGDLLEIRPAEGGNLYIPLTLQAVPRIDIAARLVIVAP